MPRPVCGSLEAPPSRHPGLMARVCPLGIAAREFNGAAARGCTEVGSELTGSASLFRRRETPPILFCLGQRVQPKDRKIGAQAIPQ